MKKILTFALLLVSGCARTFWTEVDPTASIDELVEAYGLPLPANSPQIATYRAATQPISRGESILIRADVTLGLREKIEASLARESSGKLPAEIIDYIAPAHRSLNWWPAAGFTARQYWLKPTGVDTFLLHAYVVQEDTAPHILFVLSPKKIYEEGRNRFK